MTIKNHPLMGSNVVLADGNSGKVIAVKAGPMLADMSSKIGNLKMKSTIKIHVKTEAGHLIWTGPMVYTRNMRSNTLT